MNNSKEIRILDKISPTEALTILRKLSETDKVLCSKIETLAKNIFSDVDADHIASQVYHSLDSLDVQDIWDNSGPSQYGYQEPGEIASEMFEDELDVFLNEMKRLQEIGLDLDSLHYCIGILKGIDLFESKSKSDYRNWAPDAPSECFYSVLSDWKEGCKDSVKSVAEMKILLSKNHPELENKVLSFLKQVR